MGEVDDTATAVFYCYFTAHVVLLLFAMDKTRKRASLMGFILAVSEACRVGAVERRVPPVATVVRALCVATRTNTR